MRYLEVLVDGKERFALVSEQVDVLEFFGNLFVNKASEKVSDNLENIYANMDLVVLDVAAITSDDLQKVDLLVRKNRKKTISLIPGNSNLEQRHIVENQDIQFLYFPMNFCFHKRKVQQILETLPDSIPLIKKFLYECFEYYVWQNECAESVKYKKSQMLHRLAVHDFETKVPVKLSVKKQVYNGIDGKFLGVSEEIRRCREKIIEASKLDCPVLIIGETGTGKSTAAELIHKLSNRKNAPFIPCNLARFPEALTEGFFFGVEEGSFTDAKASTGVFAQGDGGTVFLDEICIAQFGVLPHILTFCDSGTFSKLGGSKLFKVNVRLISATNADIGKMVKSGEFREDVYYRLAGTVIKIPSLKNRKEDLPYIIEDFIKTRNLEISHEALDLLCSYDWPGNFRQLNSVLQNAEGKCEKKIISAKDIDFNDNLEF